MAPPDPIIGLNEAYAKDDYPQKVIIGVGAYRDDQGKPYVLPCVREAEKRLMEANVVRRLHFFGRRRRKCTAKKRRRS